MFRYSAISLPLWLSSFDKNSLLITAHDFDFSKSAEETVILQDGCEAIEIGFKSGFLMNL